MTTAKVVKTSVTVNNNSPIQDYIHLDHRTQPTYEMTPGFKPFTDIKVTLLLVMSNQNFVLSDQDGVLVGHNVFSREKKLFTALPYSLMFGPVLKRQEMMIRQVQGIGD